MSWPKPRQERDCHDRGNPFCFVKYLRRRLTIIGSNPKKAPTLTRVMLAELEVDLIRDRPA